MLDLMLKTPYPTEKAMKTSSFKKGEDFEKFIEFNLFSINLFTLIHRTNNKNQNKERFAENTKLPDFKFRSEKNLTEFYVEAKYRSRLNSNNQLDLMKESQFDRFNAIEYKEKTPIYLLVGLGGEPSDPNKIYLIPLKDFKQGKITELFLEKHLIQQKNIKQEDLNLNEYFNEKEKIDKNSFDFKKTSLIVGVIIALILLISYLISGGHSEINENSKKPKPILIRSKAINESYGIFEYGTTVEGVVKNTGNKGYVIVRAELKQEKEKYIKSKRIFLRKNDSENFKIYFEETEFFKKKPTINVTVFGVEK